VVSWTALAAPADGAAAWRPTPGARRWKRTPRKLVEKGRKTDLFKLMKERNRTRLTSGIWARALDTRTSLRLT